MLKSNLGYTTIESVFQQGLHQFLDKTQARLNEISGAATKAYCYWMDESAQTQVQS